MTQNTIILWILTENSTSAPESGRFSEVQGKRVCLSHKFQGSILGQPLPGRDTVHQTWELMKGTLVQLQNMRMYKNKSAVANTLNTAKNQSTQPSCWQKTKNVPIQPYAKLWFRVSTQFAFLLLSSSAVEQPSAFTHWRFSHPICGVFILQSQQISAANPGMKFARQSLTKTQVVFAAMPRLLVIRVVVDGHEAKTTPNLHQATCGKTDVRT